MPGLVFAAVFFGGWAVLSILVLWRKPEARLRPHDACRLIPQWRFFAPLPNTCDYFIVYRDVFADGSFTPWTELRAVQRRWWNGLLFPSKRERKSDLDAAMQLSRMDLTRPIIETAVSIPYLLILNRVSQLPRWVQAESTQFAVALINLGVEKPAMQIFCISGLHKLK